MPAGATRGSEWLTVVTTGPSRQSAKRGSPGTGDPRPGAALQGCMTPMIRRIAAALLVGLVLYGAAPAVLEVAHAWPQARKIHFYWWFVMIGLEAGSTW